MSLAIQADEHCRPLRGPEHALEGADILTLTAQLDGWSVEGQRLVKEFRFTDFRETMRFVNSIAELAEQENHHPDMEVSYGRLRLAFSTHDVGGLSRNDFICAARIDTLTRS